MIIILTTMIPKMKIVKLDSTKIFMKGENKFDNVWHQSDKGAVRIMIYDKGERLRSREGYLSR